MCEVLHAQLKVVFSGYNDASTYHVQAKCAPAQNAKRGGGSGNPSTIMVTGSEENTMLAANSFQQDIINGGMMFGNQVPSQQANRQESVMRAENEYLRQQVRSCQE
jgi:hypothetical protein